MLSAKVLNSSATFNSYNEIGTLAFIPGEELKFVMQLHQPQHPDAIRYMTVAPEALSVTFSTKTGTLVKSMAFFAEDRSICWVTLSATDTAELVSGSITFDITGGASPIKGSLQGAVAMTIVGGC